MCGQRTTSGSLAETGSLLMLCTVDSRPADSQASGWLPSVCLSHTRSADITSAYDRLQLCMWVPGDQTQTLKLSGFSPLTTSAFLWEQVSKVNIFLLFKLKAQDYQLLFSFKLLHGVPPSYHHAPAPLLLWPGPVSFFNRKMDLQGSGNCLYDLRGKLINSKPHCLCSHPCLLFLGYEFPFPLSQSGWMLATLTKLVSKELSCLGSISWSPQCKHSHHHQFQATDLRRFGWDVHQDLSLGMTCSSAR